MTLLDGLQRARDALIVARRNADLESVDRDLYAAGLMGNDPIKLAVYEAQEHLDEAIAELGRAIWRERREPTEKVVEGAT